MKNVEIEDLKEMEEVADVAVERCRSKVVCLQKRVEKRKDKLSIVREKLADVEDDAINEECENIMKRMEMRNLEMGKMVSYFQTNQRSLEIKRQDMQENLGRKQVRIRKLDENTRNEKRQISQIKDKINHCFSV